MSRYNPSSAVCAICAINQGNLVDISYERDEEMCNRFEFLLQIKFDWEDSSITKKFCTVCIHLLRSFSLYFNWCHKVQKLSRERVDTNAVDGGDFEVRQPSKSEEFDSSGSYKKELQNGSPSTSCENRTPKIDDLVSTLPVSIKQEVIKEEIIDTLITTNLVECYNSELSFETVKTEYPCEAVLYKLPNSENPPQFKCEPDGNNNDNDQAPLHETASCVSDGRLNHDKVKNDSVEIKCPSVYKDNEKKMKRVKVPAVEKITSRSRNKILEERRRKIRKAPRMILPKSVAVSDSVSMLPPVVGGNELRIVSSFVLPHDSVYPGGVSKVYSPQITASEPHVALRAAPVYSGASHESSTGESGVNLTCAKLSHKREKRLRIPVSVKKKATCNYKDLKVHSINLKNVQNSTEEIVKLEHEIWEQLFSKDLKSNEKSFESIFMKQLKNLLEANKNT